MNTFLWYLKIFFPETTDIYDKKNMPRVVYCLHALSLYLFKLGIAPQIQDLYGVAKFTEEEITNMARELQKYGLQLPAFSKIGGILANEMPVDEAALHAAILAINDAIEKRNLETMLNGLKLMDAHLVNVHDAYIAFYHGVMYEAKEAKSNLAKTKSNDSNYIPDVYDELLTQAEIQGYINKINGKSPSNLAGVSPLEPLKMDQLFQVEKLIIEINECINQQDSELLLKLLKSKASPFKSVIDKNADWYMAQLTQEKESKLVSRPSSSILKFILPNLRTLHPSIHPATHHLHTHVDMSLTFIIIFIIFCSSTTTSRRCFLSLNRHCDNRDST